MKQLSLFNKVVLVVNLVFAILLFLGCAIPYASVEKYTFLTILGLAMPLVVGMNFLFLLYWILKKKWLFVISFVPLLTGYLAFGMFMKSGFFRKDYSEKDLMVMSYNVRGFNKEGELPGETVFEDVKKLIYLEDPDVISFQEIDYKKQKEFENYPYHHLEYIYMSGRTIMGIFSKYPILQAEIICFPESHNLGSYADILYKGDTIRVYNMHMESLGVNAKTYTQKPFDNLYQKLSTSFKKQQEQARIFREHSDASPYKKIVCGDFNNTQFSKFYNDMKGDMTDTFLEAGSGYGRTYDFYGFPLRIDFILADPEFEVTSHKNFDQKYSDHFPIVASFRLKED